MIRGRMRQLWVLLWTPEPEHAYRAEITLLQHELMLAQQVSIEAQAYVHQLMVRLTYLRELLDAQEAILKPASDWDGIK